MNHEIEPFNDKQEKKERNILIALGEALNRLRLRNWISGTAQPPDTPTLNAKIGEALQKEEEEKKDQE